VLVDFVDAPMSRSTDQFRDLFFSTGKIPTGSVREYFTEVSGNLITITGEVVGPYRLPRSLATYAGGGSGVDNPEPNARTMARDAAQLANADVDFAPFDNDGNGFVDAFIVMHAGSGAEETGSGNHIWSHKWVLAGGAFNADTTKIFAYLTVRRLPDRVCARAGRLCLAGRSL
jgi:immune inhibitor A